MQILDIGCGTGAITRILAEKAAEGKVVGVDPSPIFLEKALELSRDFSNIVYTAADGRLLPFEEGSFEVALFHTVLTHMPNPESFLSEAYRVLKPGGFLVIFDGDYASRTVALGRKESGQLPGSLCFWKLKSEQRVHLGNKRYQIMWTLIFFT